MEEKKQYSALTIDRAAFLLLRVKKAFKKKKLQRKERERNAQLALASRIDQRASCAGLEVGTTTTSRKKPPLLRSRTLPAIIIPGVNILQAQLGTNEAEKQQSSSLSSRSPLNRVSFSSHSSTDDNNTLGLDIRRKSAISRLYSGNYGPERGADGTLLLRVPAPHVVAAQAYRISQSTPSGSNTTLYRLSKFLNQTGSKNQMIIDDNNVTRRLSWERRDTINSRLPRSSSIDSMVEVVWSESVPIETPSMETTLRVPTEKRLSFRSDRTFPLMSPSMGRRMKGQRGLNEFPTLLTNNNNNEMAHNNNNNRGLLLPPPPPPPSSSILDGHKKPSKKEAKLMQQRLEHLAKINIHLHALFAAVEHGHLEKARTILESTDVDVNSLNNDGLSPLDVAVLSNNRSMVKMLMSFGAKEGHRFSNSEKLGTHLKQLLGEAEMRLQELGGLLEEAPCGAPLNTRASFSSIIGSAYPSTTAMTGCAGGDNDKQLIAWNRRAKTLKRLVLGFAQARPPDPPGLVAVDIIASSAVAVRLQESPNCDSSITTKFKVQWSTRADFSIISGEKELFDLSAPCAITTIELTQGRRYFFKAYGGNLKGYGTCTVSSPASVVPSSWRELETRSHFNFTNKMKQLDQLIDEIKQIRPDSELLLDTNVVCGIGSGGGDNQRRQQKKKTTIKQLFTAASKFQKNLRRGIYLACILYHEDKVLVTNEDFLPVIEIDESYPSNTQIQTDFNWLMKISCCWSDTKLLKLDMEKNTTALSSTQIHFRLKLLSAIIQMQQSLCLQDLGKLYFKLLKDEQGIMVLSTINYVKTPKSVSVLNSRWLPLNKVYKKICLGQDQNISEILMASIQQQINYHQNSNLKLSKGLYLCYLKMQSSVDLIHLVVPVKSPNMLPHCKIRDNPHVSAEEWEYLKQQNLPDVTEISHVTEQQRTFLELITSATKRLFNYMDINNQEALNHRLYDTEIIELLSDHISFIVICPSVEQSCSVPGQREFLLQHGDFINLPIQTFEMIHLQTYQLNIIRKYAKLSCLLELDTVTANHLHREAFSNTELQLARERVNILQELQMKLNQIWKSVRWLMDLIAFTRDRLNDGILTRYLLNKELMDMQSSPKRSLLEIPMKNMKTQPGRGSWPGPSIPNNNNTSELMMCEFSKSEQHLSVGMMHNNDSRKNSFGLLAPSVGSDEFIAHLQPKQQQQHCSSVTSSPLLSVKYGGGSLISVNTATTTDSLHSLSSDSEQVTSLLLHNKIVPSKSMTSVKQFVDGDKTTTTTTTRQQQTSSIDRSNLKTNLSKSLSNIKANLNLPSSTNNEQFKLPSSTTTTTTTTTNDQGILQVYAAYDTGLAVGTSLKLHVTNQTTAREVVDLVVKQLNMAVVLKVTVIGARERCLRDDFKPLQLQNPWKKGRLYVRQKQDVLAALEHCSKYSNNSTII